MDNSSTTIDELAANLGTTSPRLQELAARLPLATDFRISSVHIGRHHRRVLVPLIHYDTVVKRLRQFLMDSTNYTPLPNVSGFIKGRSTRSNAIQHLDKNCVLRLDIRRFFDSIDTAMVYNALSADTYPPDICALVSALATPEGFLATGLSTSPHLSNLVFDDTDKALGELAAALGLTYTRYVDDLAFSGDVDDSAAAQLTQLIRDHGWTLNERKTAFMRRGHRQYVTGLSVSDKTRPHVPRWLKRAMRWRLHVIEKFGYDEYMHRFGGLEAGHYPRSLLGLAQYVGRLEPTLGEPWIDRWASVLPEFWEDEEDEGGDLGDRLEDYVDFVGDSW
jgi:hypothetical protein